MPAEGKTPLTDQQVEIIRWWITVGAPNGGTMRRWRSCRGHARDADERARRQLLSLQARPTARRWRSRGRRGSFAATATATVAAEPELPPSPELPRLLPLASLRCALDPPAQQGPAPTHAAPERRATIRAASPSSSRARARRKGRVGPPGVGACRGSRRCRGLAPRLRHASAAAAVITLARRRAPDSADTSGCPLVLVRALALARAPAGYCRSASCASARCLAQPLSLVAGRERRCGCDNSPFMPLRPCCVASGTRAVAALAFSAARYIEPSLSCASRRHSS